MKLSDAYLCLECDQITDVIKCPLCGSPVTMLSNVIKKGSLKLLKDHYLQTKEA